MGRAVLVCACDLEPCPACAAREAAEWEPDTDAPLLDPDYLALFYGDAAAGV